MSTSFLDSRFVRAMGSVMDICPVGDYSQYIPTNRNASIKSYWVATGKYFDSAIAKHERKPSGSRSDASRS